jgi:hypothetical protein
MIIYEQRQNTINNKSLSVLEKLEKVSDELDNKRLNEELKTIRIKIRDFITDRYHFEYYNKRILYELKKNK